MDEEQYYRDEESSFSSRSSIDHEEEMSTISVNTNDVNIETEEVSIEERVDRLKRSKYDDEPGSISKQMINPTTQLRLVQVILAGLKTYNFALHFIFGQCK